MVSIPGFLGDLLGQLVTQNTVQRIELYGILGYQLPQEIPQEAWDAYHKLVAMGYDKQLVK